MDRIGTLRVQEDPDDGCLTVELKIAPDTWIAHYLDPTGDGNYGGSQHLSEGVAIGQMDASYEPKRLIVYRPSHVAAV